MTGLGDRIRKLREAKNMSQTELAKAAGVSQATISDAETGETKSGIRALTLLRIAAALDTNPEYLRTGKGPPDATLPTGTEADLLTLFGKLNQQNRDALVAAAKALAESQSHST
jgi:transcriptional regulator with XRE-family HTH domain